VGKEMKKFRDFESARDFVRSLGLQRQKEWNDYCKSGDKPDNIPAKPERTYKKEWKGTGDWLGTGRVANFNKQYRPFKDAREFVRSLGLKGVVKWIEYCKSGNKPDDIPVKPERTYKNEWKSYGDWLGTGRIANQNKTYRPFKEAREFVHSLNLEGTQEWFEYCKSEDKPEDIPVSPIRTYKNEWKSYGDWLGTGTIASQNKQFHPFKDARDFVRSLGLKGDREWRNYCTSGNKPDDIPSAPERIYKNKGYLDLGDWLGTGTIAPKNMEFRPFKEAREFVRKLGLKNQKEWGEYCKSGNKPDDIPTNPWNVYKEWEKK
jgi:hypothetical protein